jgi:hypothetical protein
LACSFILLIISWSNLNDLGTLFSHHAEYISGSYNPYPRQIDDYIGYAKAKFGVLIFSGGNEELWDDLLTQEGTNAAWTILTPSLTGDKNATNDKNLKLMQHCYDGRS